QHSLALRGDGTVAAWGDNSYGQASVPAGLTNVVAVAAASYGSVALKADGTLVAWGYWALPAGLTNIVATAISAGGDQDLALLTQWPPEILVQPVSAQDYTGKEHTLRVSATSNDPLTYQWQFNGNDLAGATNSSLTLHFLHFEDAGTYTVTVSSALGSVF